MTTFDVTGVVKRFGPLTALDGAGMSARTGECHGLIGPNGSGKSTFLHCISGRLMPDEGSVEFDGKDITRWSPARRARAGISIKFQQARVYRELSVRDNLLLTAQSSRNLLSLLGSTSRRALRAEVDRLIGDFALEEYAERRAGQLSHGQQQFLEIAMAVSRRPAVLLLDEPTAGMSREERAETGRLIRRLAVDSAVIIIEHDLQFIRDLCDQITVLHQGGVVACGTPAEISANARVREVYLTRV